MARADFGRTEVDGVLTAIGKVAVALAARDGDDDGSQAPKAVERRQRGQRAGEGVVWRVIAAGGTGKAVVDPRSRLDGEGMERRRQVGCSQEDASGRKHNPEEALGV